MCGVVWCGVRIDMVVEKIMSGEEAKKMIDYFYEA